MSVVVALLTDFGLRDAYVGVVKGVILARNPAATLVDLCHEVPPQDVRRGAFLLATSLAYFPPAAIVLAVVDPGVGTARRGLAVEAADWRLVGPDNGLLAWAVRFLARAGRLTLRTSADGRLHLGEGVRAVHLTESHFWLPAVSSTFHGRDVFGPVVAELSLGRPLDDFGPSVDEIVDLPWPEPRPAADGLMGEVVTVDTYGNLVTNLTPDDLPASPTLEIAGRRIRGLAPHFQSSEPLLALLGSTGFVELAAPNASAAALLDARAGTPVRVAGSA